MIPMASSLPGVSSSARRLALPLAVALALLAGPARGAQLVEVRIGEYENFTRIVFELDQAAGYRVERRDLPDGGQELVVTLAVTSPSGSVPTRSGRIESFTLQDEGAGAYAKARVRYSAPDLEIRDLVLQDPPRLVIDAVTPQGAAQSRARNLQSPIWVEKLPLVAATAAGPEPEAAGTATPDVTPPPTAEPATGVVAGEPAPAAGTPPGAAPAAAPQAGEPSFAVTRFELRYARPHPEHLPVEELEGLPIELGQVPDGYVAPSDGIPTVTLTLAESFAPPANRFYASAILSINQQLVRALNSRGYVGVLVEPSEEDVARQTAEDLRPATRTELALVILTVRVKDIRTFASGQRVPEDQRLDNPKHARIVEHSPVLADGTHDLMRKDLLDAYVARLNRHPGRRVDLLVSPAREPGGAYLDYLVSEFKPWYAYAGVSNTGTESTTKWRQRFGFRHHQLTGHDDILAVDYVTGNFDSVNFLHVFYDVPIYKTERFRARPFGSWNEYDSSVLGFPGRPFQGTGWYVGGQVTGTVYQRGNFFVDLLAGLRWARAEVDNKTFGTSAESDFFLPQGGVHTQLLADTRAFFADVFVEGNVPSVAGTSLSEIQNFGRLPVDDDWVKMSWDSAAWLYLEPLIFGDDWNDPSTPKSSTLAHEVYAGFRGQYGFGSRLIPQEMAVAGGLFSVRGYEEAVAVGDTTLIGNLEYRLHVPRLFRPDPEPAKLPLLGDFRVAPQQVYGQPDWDLVVRAFFDVGRTIRADRTSVEQNETLLGTGIGLELLFKRNLSARFDYGWALKDLNNGLNDAGDGEAYFVVRLLY